MRQYGMSKEHRPNPIVEMGLFMDSKGIPITMCLHPGNTGEQLTAIPLEEDILKILPGAKFIYCADAGLGPYNIQKFNSMGATSLFCNCRKRDNRLTSLYYLLYLPTKYIFSFTSHIYFSVFEADIQISAK